MGNFTLLFNKLEELDKECSELGYEVSHSILQEEDATVGLTVDQYFVTITKQYCDAKEVESVCLSLETFEKMYELYKVHKGIGG